MALKNDDLLPFRLLINEARRGRPETARRAALESLKAMDRVKFLEKCGQLLSDPDPEMRCYAAEISIAVAPHEAEGHLPLLFRDISPVVRKTGIKLAARVGNLEVLRSLITLLDLDPDSGVRFEACVELGRRGDLNAVPPLRLARLDLGTDYEGRIISDFAVDSIVKIYRRTYPIARSYDGDEIRDLMLGLKSLDADLVDDATRRLKTVDTPRLLAAIRGLSVEEDSRSKLAAIAAADQLELIDVRGLIEPLSKDPDPDVRGFAIALLEDL
jgi:hypothetical protein